jgi:hypothetical protein
MTQSKQYKGASPATTDTKRKSKLGHWMRVVAMFLSLGFIFPNALSEDEDMDVAKYDTAKDAQLKKQ